MSPVVSQLQALTSVVASPFAWVAITVSLLYFPSLVIYRIFFHPLSGLPGSRWAAASSWYDVYWNIWKRGSLIFEINRLHERHGPIIRIAPNEVHVSTPQVYPILFKPGTKFLKDKPHYDSYCLPEALPGKIKRTEIRTRREVYRQVLDRKAIKSHWPALSQKLKVLLSRLEERKDDVVVHDALSAFSLDIASEMAFSKDFQALDRPNLDHPFIKEAQEASQILWFTMLFPTLRNLVVAIEPYCREVYHAFKPTNQVATFRIVNSIESKISDYLKSTAQDPSHTLTKKSNFMTHFLNPKAARTWIVPDISTLAQEFVAMIGGATETIAITETCVLYEIARNPEVQRKLQKELDMCINDPIPLPFLDELENLSYLKAVIKESLRVHSGIPGRTPRVVPDDGLEVEGFLLPKGTIISMSAYVMHRRDEIFLDGDSFIPERWLQPDTSALENYFVTFCRGVGECPGKTLAYAELYALTASIVRRFDLELGHGVTEENMRWTDSVIIRLPNPKLRLKLTSRI